MEMKAIDTNQKLNWFLVLNHFTQFFRISIYNKHCHFTLLKTGLGFTCSTFLAINSVNSF